MGRARRGLAGNLRGRGDHGDCAQLALSTGRTRAPGKARRCGAWGSKCSQLWKGLGTNTSEQERGRGAERAVGRVVGKDRQKQLVTRASRGRGGRGEQSRLGMGGGEEGEEGRSLGVREGGTRAT